MWTIFKILVQPDPFFNVAPSVVYSRIFVFAVAFEILYRMVYVLFGFLLPKPVLPKYSAEVVFYPWVLPLVLSFFP